MCLQEMRKEFLMLFIAIASHKLISGLALSSRFLKEGATTRQASGWLAGHPQYEPEAAALKFAALLCWCQHCVGCFLAWLLFTCLP